MPAKTFDNLNDIETWVFDLDNTLYPATCNLFAQIDVRMRDFISAFLGLEPDEAYKIQKHYFREYGTTLRGMMTCHDMDPYEFLDHVHDIDVSPVPPSPELDAALKRLPGRKVIFTNATVEHAERVTDRLGVSHHFDGVFDICRTDFIPKPDPSIYDLLVADFGIDPAKSVMIEDISRNLAPAASLGMTTVWIKTDTKWGHASQADDHVHHVIEDLNDWLAEILP
ncbi:MAG: pyrimidine 5'-nucleotidase [Rhodospirillaceae bacterium]|jgi:putative hydrolase of the HAD superfamily